MKPINRVFKLSENDTIQIMHIGSKDPVTVWLSKSLMLDSKDCILMVNGRVGADGYLPVKVKVNGKVAYPRDKLCCLINRASVTLEFTGVSSDNIKEVFLCDQRDKDRVIFAMYRKSLELTHNDEQRSLYIQKMTEISERWRDAP